VITSSKSIQHLHEVNENADAGTGQQDDGTL